MRSERKIRKHCEFMREDYEWFIINHHVEIDDTNKTGFSATMSMLLHNYRRVCENPADFELKNITPLDITIEAAKLVKEEKEAEQRRSGDKEA